MRRTNRRSEQPANSSTARRGRAGAAGQDALNHATAALQRAGFPDATLVLRWREIVGDEIARIAEPLRLSEGPEGAVLTLRCEAGAAVFLQHQTRDLLERLAAYLGPSRIARVRLVPGELARRDGPPDHPSAGLPIAVEPPSPATLSQALDRLEQRRTRARTKTR
jgi:hypothetical protein